ncbi:MAG: lipopolysaccharide biosynthesis protein [bacterium]
MKTKQGLRIRSKSLIDNAAWNLLGLVINMIISFIIVPIVVKGIGVANYGIYAILASIGGFAALMNLGMGTATTKYVSEYHGKNDFKGINRVLGATLTINAIGGMLGCVVLVICASWIASLFKLNPEQVVLTEYLLKVAAISFFLNIYSQTFLAVPRALQRYDIFQKINIMISVIDGAAKILVIKLGYGLKGLVFWLVGHSLVNLLMFWGIIRKIIPGIQLWPKITSHGLREVYEYGIFSSLNQIIGTIASQIDRIILGIFFGPEEVAYLNIPKNLLMKGAGVYRASGRALFPKFSAMNDEAFIQNLFFKSTWSLLCLSLVLFIPITIILPGFLGLWISEEFSQHSALTAQIISASMALRGAFIPYEALLKGTGRIHWLTLLYFVTTTINIIAAIVLISIYGLLGAGARMWVTVWLGFMVILFVSKKVFPKVSLWDVIVMLSIPIFLSLLCGIVFYQFYGRWASFGWLQIITAWLIMASLLLLVVWTTNRLLSGPAGAGGQLYAALQKFLYRLYLRFFSKSIA